MKSTLSYMVERSRFDIARLQPSPEGAPPAQARLVDDAASALFACSYLQACGTMFTRQAADRRAATLEGAIREAGLEAAVAARLRHKAGDLLRFFTVH